MAKTLIVLLILFSTFLTTINAQETMDSEIDLTAEEQEMLEEEDRPVEIENSNLLKADLVQNTQNPNSKKAVFEMIFVSAIDTDRLRVTWTVSRNLIVEDEETLTRAFSGIRAGQEYRIPLEVTPNGRAVHEIEGVVRIVGADSNAIATVRKNFASNSSSEILPLTDQYNQKKLIETIKTVFMYVIIAVVLGVVSFFSWEKFKKWYSKD